MVIGALNSGLVATAGTAVAALIGVKILILLVLRILKMDDKSRRYRAGVKRDMERFANRQYERSTYNSDEWREYKNYQRKTTKN